MEFLWKSRHRGSDLVGTIINIHNGDWVRKGYITHTHTYSYISVLI